MVARRGGKRPDHGQPEIARVSRRAAGGVNDAPADVDDFEPDLTARCGPEVVVQVHARRRQHGVRWPEEDRGGRRADRAHLPERSDVIELPDGTSLRRRHEVVAANVEVVDRDARHVQPQRFPAGAIVERHIDCLVRASEDESRARGVGNRHVDGLPGDAPATDWLSLMFARRQMRDLSDRQMMRGHPRLPTIEADFNAVRVRAYDAAQIGGIGPPMRVGSGRRNIGTFNRRPRVAAIDRLPRAAARRGDDVNARFAWDADDGRDRPAVVRPDAAPGETGVEVRRNRLRADIDRDGCSRHGQCDKRESAESGHIHDRVPNAYRLPPRPAAAAAGGTNVHDGGAVVVAGAILSGVRLYFVS